MVSELTVRPGYGSLSIWSAMTRNPMEYNVNNDS